MACQKESDNQFLLKNGFLEPKHYKDEKWKN